MNTRQLLRRECENDPTLLFLFFHCILNWKERFFSPSTPSRFYNILRSLKKFRYILRYYDKLFLFLFLFFIKKVNIRCIRRLSLFAYLALDIKKEKMFKKRRKVVISIAHNNKNVRIFSYLVKNSWKINACRFETSLRVRVIKPKFNGDESIMRSAYTNEIPGTLSPFSHFPSTPRPSIVSQSYNAAILESVPSPPPIPFPVAEYPRPH